MNCDNNLFPQRYFCTPLGVSQWQNQWQQMQTAHRMSYGLAGRMELDLTFAKSIEAVTTKPKKATIKNKKRRITRP